MASPSSSLCFHHLFFSFSALLSKWISSLNSCDSRIPDTFSILPKTTVGLMNTQRGTKPHAKHEGIQSSCCRAFIQSRLKVIISHRVVKGTNDVTYKHICPLAETRRSETAHWTRRDPSRLFDPPIISSC